MDRHMKFCNLSGNFDVSDRSLIRNELEKFGKTRKIYLTNTFTKVYFENEGSCERAVQGLRNNAFGWIVELGEEKPHQSSRNLNKEGFKGKSNMDDYLDQDFLESYEYCDIHGNPLTTFQGEYTNELFIKLNDIRRAGFAVFRRDSYDRLIVNKNQIFKEFELHLLSEAKNYILKNRVGEIDEEQILKTIERCKTKLLGDQSTGNSNSFSTARKVVSSDQNMKITSSVPQHRSGYESFDSSETIPPQRPPKVLSNNFVPSHRTNNQKSYQGSRDNGRDTNGFGSDREQSSNQAKSNNANYRSRTRDDGTQLSDSSNHSRQGFNARERNSQFDNNSATTQRYKPEDGGSQFPQNPDRRQASHQSRDNFNRYDKSSETSERRPRQEFEVNEQLKKIELRNGDAYNVKICYVEKENGKDNICWVHKHDMTSDLEDVILKLLDAGPECEVESNPKTGQLCVALFEEAWYRCKVLKSDPLLVQFLDYGNKSSVDSVRVLPDEFKKIPALAIRLVLSNFNDNVIILEEEVEIKVKIKHQYDDGTYLVESDKQTPVPSRQEETQIEEAPKKTLEQEEPKRPQKEVAFEEATLSPIEKPTKKPAEKKIPTEKRYFDVPKPLNTLKNGDMIMVCGMLDNKFAVKTRDCATKTKEVLDYIKSLDKSTLMLSNVQKGQLVLCSIDGLPNLCRAIVLDEPSAGAVTVRYLDYAGENQMTLKSLRNVDDFLAGHPTCLLLTRESPLLENLNAKDEAFVAQLIEKKTKVKLVLSGDDFDMELDDGSLLLQNIRIADTKSEKIEKPVEDIKLIPVKQQARVSEQVATPAKAEQVKSIQKSEKVNTPPRVLPVKAKEVVDSPPVMYDDMDWIKAEVGTTEEFMCYTIKDLENVTLISLTDDSLKHLDTLSELVVEDDIPYEPEMYEMCMVSYKAPDEPEASWYRGAVMEKKGEKITVNSVDYGTNIIVTKKDIRKFDKNYKDVPILGIICEFTTIPDNAKVLEKLKEMIPEGEQVTVVLKDFDGLKYQIEVPEVVSELKKLGLM